MGGAYVLKDSALVKIVFKPDNGIKNIFSRNAIQEEGRQLTKRGDFQEALTKYQEAIQPQYINDEYEKGTAIAMMRSIYLVLQDYDAALKCIEWAFKNSLDGKPTVYAMEIKNEIEALKNYQRTGDPQSVLNHMKQFFVDHKADLPPQGHDESSVSTLIRLYNTIGEHDAGIKFIDDFLDWSYNKPNTEFENFNKPKTSSEALKIGKWNELSVKNRDPTWRAYKYVGQLLMVREGFERDKAEGFKGCAGKKPGEVCVGHATKAIIQSDYFPW